VFFKIFLGKWRISFQQFFITTLHKKVAVFFGLADKNRYRVAFR